LKDRKIKARTAVVLIVVVGVGVTGASREFACWRFFRYALQINVPRASKYYNAVFGAFLNRLDREAWRRFASAFRSHP
jgi:predicted helicase